MKKPFVLQFSGTGTPTPMSLTNNRVSEACRGSTSLDIFSDGEAHALTVSGTAVEEESFVAIDDLSDRDRVADSSASSGSACLPASEIRKSLHP